MRAALLLLRLALLLTPAEWRARAAEEWRADLAGCVQFGIAPAAVASGAAAAAVRARAALIGRAATSALESGAAALVGVVLGAICALGDVSVLAVVLAAVLMQGAVLVISRCRARATRRAPQAIPSP